ncbi:MAG: PqqD family protein [Candidatus Riflebacteria bacterium]|nr:PqqD family protein [Candidatus Riflebacteria bacterium]
MPTPNGIPHNRNEVFKLGGTGRVVWDVLDGKRDVNALVFKLVNRFEAEEQLIRNDVEKFLKELLQRHLIFEVVNPNLS